MKVFLFTLLSSLLLISPGLVNALELKDGTQVDSSNAHLYIQENISKFTNFNSSWFPNGFKAVVISNYKENIDKIIIYNSYIFYDTELFSEVYFNGPFLNIFFNKNDNCFYQYWNSTSCLDMSSSSVGISIINGNDYTNLKKIAYISEDLYYEDKLIMEKNWNYIPTYYEVKFNIPKGSTLIVKDKDNNIVNLESNNTYKLSNGNYTYSVSKSLYNTYSGSISVSEDTTIDVELTPIMDLSHFDDIFTSYKQYLLYLVPSLFNLENPFFFIVFGIAILFSLFLLVKKLLKGRF